MRYEIEVNGRLRHAEVHRANGSFVVVLDGHAWLVDAAAIGGHVLSLLARSAGELPTGVGAMDAIKAAARTDRRGGESHEVTVAHDAAGQLMIGVGPATLPVALNSRRRAGADAAHGRSGPQRIVAPMPGKIVRILAKVGEPVHARQPVVVIEAMKMENELRALADGVVTEIHGKEGQSVDAGTLLAVVGEP